jgi:hypothetical protein
MSVCEWVVNELPPDSESDEQWEVSLVRSDNEHGLRSFGWDDENKIIIADGSSYAPYSDDELENCKHAMYRAKVMADALNKEKL